MKNLFQKTEPVSHKFAFYETPSHIDQNHATCQADAEALATDLTKEDLNFLKTECDLNRTIDYSREAIRINGDNSMDRTQQQQAAAQNGHRELLQSQLEGAGKSREFVAGIIQRYDAIQKLSPAERAHAEMDLNVELGMD